MENLLDGSGLLVAVSAGDAGAAAADVHGIPADRRASTELLEAP